MKKPDVIEAGDKVILAGDFWEAVKFYKIKEISGLNARIVPFNDFFEKSEAIVLERPEAEKIFVSPYTLKYSKSHEMNAAAAHFIKDFASTHLRKSIRIEITILLELISAEPRLKKIPKEFIANCLKCCVADGIFLVRLDKRKKDKIINLELSEHQIEVEKRRKFAGTLASELTNLSERVRNLIRHTSSVGTYRENLLQSLLKKHLPERYHVATGFIYGTHRQLDVLIYDRIEYAPLFREGDLVVVPPEAVRAVIEVKTDLTKVQLISSLKLIDEVSVLDNCVPPFFKGIFGFESDLDAEGINKEVSEFYNKEIDDLDDINSIEMNPIITPFRHLTSMCVLEKLYSEVQFEKNGEPSRYRPTLCFTTSATGLNSQVTHFLQRLLSYLKSEGIKPSKSNEMLRMLGADSRMNRYGYLAPESWGPYFMFDERGSEEDEIDVTNMEGIIDAVNSWVYGGAWVPPKESS
jgi:hypothetical protein